MYLLYVCIFLACLLTARYKNMLFINNYNNF